MKRVSQSPSRIKLFQDCSYKYFLRYVFRLPDKSNDGAKRGTLVHLVLECLINKRHRKYINQLLSLRDYSRIPSISVLVTKHAKKLGINDSENLKLVNEMILTGVSGDFTCGKAKEILSEQRFEIETERYVINGIIDKIAIYDNEITIYDYKTSKQKFDEGDIDGNLQVFFYSLYCFKKYGIIPSVEFLFLRFPDDPSVKPKKCTLEELQGFENYLAYLDVYLKDFGLPKATSNYAFDDSDKKWLCGYAKERGQLTKAGKAFFYCPYKFPFDYYALVDKETGAILKTDEDPDALKETDKTKIVFKRYNGCPKFGNKVTRPEQETPDF